MTDPRAEKPAATSERKHEERELDEALKESFPASDPPAMTTPSSITGPEVARSDDGTERSQMDEKLDAELDEALEESFPASDPPAMTSPSSITGPEVARTDDEAETTDKAKLDRKLDRELEQTFPASDPLTVVRKHHHRDA